VTQRACSGATVTFTWTAENRLASLTIGGVTTTYDYNAAGRLVRKTSGGVTRHFLWEGDNLLAELDAVTGGMQTPLTSLILRSMPTVCTCIRPGAER
jgi:YD repeat-containing protein